jgi:NADP-dependent 3-hydroxy acid dehydrogenase YdfG
VRAVSAHGDNVTAVGWSKEDNLTELQSWQYENSIGLLCDVRVRESVEEVVKKSIERWGRVDVVAKYVS